MALLKEIASKIPDNVRSSLLITDTDPIYNASANQNNENMIILARIWYEFIEPDKEFTKCAICLTNILTNFRQMKSDLVELENEYQQLKNL